MHALRCPPPPADARAHHLRRVREAFAGSGIAVEEGPVDTTVSIGVAGGPAGTELEVLLAAADTALYQAKRSGRNRVICETDPETKPVDARVA